MSIYTCAKTVVRTVYGSSSCFEVKVEKESRQYLDSQNLDSEIPPRYLDSWTVEISTVKIWAAKTELWLGLGFLLGLLLGLELVFRLGLVIMTVQTDCPD